MKKARNEEEILKEVKEGILQGVETEGLKFFKRLRNRRILRKFISEEERKAFKDYLSTKKGKNKNLDYLLEKVDIKDDFKRDLVFSSSAYKIKLFTFSEYLKNKESLYNLFQKSKKGYALKKSSGSKGLSLSEIENAVNRINNNELNKLGQKLNKKLLEEKVDPLEEFKEDIEAKLNGVKERLLEKQQELIKAEKEKKEEEKRKKEEEAKLIEKEEKEKEERKKALELEKKDDEDMEAVVKKVVSDNKKEEKAKTKKAIDSFHF